ERADDRAICHLGDLSEGGVELREGAGVAQLALQPRLALIIRVPELGSGLIEVALKMPHPVALLPPDNLHNVGVRPSIGERNSHHPSGLEGRGYEPCRYRSARVKTLNSAQHHLAP